MSQPPAVFGPPPLPPGTPTGMINLHLRSPGRLSSSMMSPRLQIDGQPAPARWDTSTYVVPAGQRHVDVWVEYLFPHGRNATYVDVGPGQVVDVFYASPYLTFLRGAIGPTPQARPGRAAVIGLAVFVLLILLGSLVSVLVLN